MNHRPRRMSSSHRLPLAILAASIASWGVARADINGFSSSTFTLNANPEATAGGAPTINGSVLNLTTAVNGEATSAYFNTQQSITNFTATFTYDFVSGSGNPADGFAFVLQNVAANALGAAGGGVGYAGIGSSAAVKFNIYNDDGIGLGSGGTLLGTSASGVSLTGANPVNIRLDYNGSLLGVRVTDSVTGAVDSRSYVIGNLASTIGSSTAYVGFSGGTGGENAAQALSNFNFTVGTGVVVPQGFRVRQVQLNSGATSANAGGGTVNGELENIDEGEALLNSAAGFANGGELTGFFSTVNNAFPRGGGDQFAVSADGYIDLNNDGFDGDTGTYTLYVDSDDGFRLRLNGNTIGEFFGPTGNSNTTISNVVLKDGDRLTLNFFEKGGGEKLLLRVNDAAGAFVGSTASGIGVTQVPEPGAASLLALGAAALGLRRRRHA